MNEMSQPIRFLLNDRVIEVGDVPPTTSILSFLREKLGRAGTKEGCAEGDCGACTVVLAESRKGRLEMKPVNACIQFLPTLDGKALFTVEDLRTREGHLHPVQEAMVECHGSQCGFCTPGFVMSLWSLYLDCTTEKAMRAPDERMVRQAITGNLCRCTGYRPIIDAGKRMTGFPLATFDRAALLKSLESLRRDTSLHYMHRGHSFHAPRTLSELMALRVMKPSSTILAGGTDVGLWVNKQFRELGDIVYTGEVAELQSISESESSLDIGAAVSLNGAYHALKSHYPEMNEMWERFASAPIRNAGTLGGNIANGSPIGDAMPALIALGASVTLSSPCHSRQLPLEELYIDYQENAIRADEVLACIHIPKPTPGLLFRNYKLSKRYDSDISAVCAAFAIEQEGGTIIRCRIAFGGMAATPKRALGTEARLSGAKWNEATVRTAMDALAKDFTPLSDMRASAEYRHRAARNLLYRFFLETRPVDAMAVGQLNVFA